MDNESVYSYDVGDADQFIKNIGGRAFNALNEAYMLPADETEWQRLDKQHVALTLAMGSLVPCPPEIVDAVLAPITGEQRRILDIGCGAGTWALEMSKQFPHCQVVGVDLAPPPLPTSAMPKNLRFEIDNVNYGLAHFYGQFDLVHARSVAAGMDDYGTMCKEAEKCLKPGGLVIFMDGDPRLLAEDQLSSVKFPGQEYASGGSWFRKIAYEAAEACKLAGSNLDLADAVLNEGLWSRLHHKLMDPETAAAGAVVLPIGPWATVPDIEQNQRLYYVGSLMRQNFISIHRAYHGRLLKRGIDEWTLGQWSARADEELMTCVPRIWVRFRFMWGRRRAGPKLPAPPLPFVQPIDIFNTFGAPTANSSPSFALVPPTANYLPIPRHNPIHYPYFYIWDSAETNALEIQRRKRADCQYPPSEVRQAWLTNQMRENATAT